MATKDWKTASVRIPEEVNAALKLTCGRRKITRNQLLGELLAKELEPVLDSKALDKTLGIPPVGEHLFVYDIQSDTFTWKLDLGQQGAHILSKDLPSKFLETIQKKIQLALQERDKKTKEIKDKSIIPNELLKFKVRT